MQALLSAPPTAKEKIILMDVAYWLKLSFKKIKINDDEIVRVVTRQRQCSFSADCVLAYVVQEYVPLQYSNQTVTVVYQGLGRRAELAGAASSIYHLDEAGEGDNALASVDSSVRGHDEVQQGGVWLVLRPAQALLELGR
jgi:hypothetical protein